MLVIDAFELVGLCFEQTSRLMDKNEFKDVFIAYVFTRYQEEVVARYGQEGFYENLHQLGLEHCRSDFDDLVERWYESHYRTIEQEIGYHELLFSLVVEAHYVYQSTSRKELLLHLMEWLTSSSGFMGRWRERHGRSVTMYYRYLDRLGIRTYRDVECLVDTWMMEHPDAFIYGPRRMRRGRPYNAELSLLIEKVAEMKAELTAVERERVRKIYYYHRKSLDTNEMIQKFEKYVLVKAAPKQESEPQRSPGAMRLG